MTFDGSGLSAEDRTLCPVCLGEVIMEAFVR